MNQPQLGSFESIPLSAIRPSPSPQQRQNIVKAPQQRWAKVRKAGAAAETVGA